MITKFTVRCFKSLEDVEVSLGNVNVFVGANGSGKSNLLEAIGVLSAAAAGRVDDESLMRRGVRPGVPKLYKSAFPGRRPQHVFFGAESNDARYEVRLVNPSSDPKPAWRYHTERWQLGDEAIVARSDMATGPNPGAGRAALRAVDLAPDDPAVVLLNALRDFAIYEPNTPTLRGISPENQPREPVGLSGGGLPAAVMALVVAAQRNKRILAAFRSCSSLIDWAKDIGGGTSTGLPISPSAASSGFAIRFVDRFMAKGHNVLSGADASEGALYVLFAAVLALDERAPRILAVDNADHGLNPRLAQSLVAHLSRWILENPEPRQVLLTTHNPQVLDGLPLQDDRVRLFTVARTNTGRTAVRRVLVNEKLLKMAEKGWTLSRLWVMGHLGGVPNV